MKIEIVITSFIFGSAFATLVVLSIIQKKVRINVYVIEKSKHPVLYVIVTIFWILSTLLVWGAPWIVIWVEAL